MSQIQAKWTRSGQHIDLRGHNDGPQARLKVFGQIWAISLGFGPSHLDLGHHIWIWAITLGFGPLRLDLGHFAWIWAIWHNLGHRKLSHEDGAGGQLDGRTESPCVLQDFVPFGAAAQKQWKLHPEEIRNAKGVWNHRERG